MPRGGDRPHLLDWCEAGEPPRAPSRVRLSQSEHDVLVDAAEGLTTHESAARRRKSAETVKTQRRTVLAKLGGRNMVQAVAIAAREGILGDRAA